MGISGDQQSTVAPPRRRRRRWLASACIALAVLVIAFAILASQGGEDGGGGPLNAIAQAAEKTRSQPGGRATIRMVATKPGSKPIPMWGSLVYDDEDRTRAVLTVLPPGSDESFQMNMVTEGTTMYMSSRKFGSLPNGAKWMSLDLTLRQEGPVPGNPDAMGELELLETATDDVRKLGEEKVRGVPTTHYRGIIGVDTQAERVRDLGAEELAGRIEEESEPTRVDVWIDAEGLVRRTKIVHTQPQVEDQGTESVEMRMDFSDFGSEPAIDVPDSDEVFDATALTEEELRDR
jgi:hypothetical protein